MNDPYGLAHWPSDRTFPWMAQQLVIAAAIFDSDGKLKKGDSASNGIISVVFEAVQDAMPERITAATIAKQTNVAVGTVIGVLKALMKSGQVESIRTSNGKSLEWQLSRALWREEYVPKPKKPKEEKVDVYKVMDNAIIEAVAAGCDKFSKIAGNYEVNEEAARISSSTGRPIDRILDNRLQALRKKKALAVRGHAWVIPRWDEVE